MDLVPGVPATGWVRLLTSPHSTAYLSIYSLETRELDGPLAGPKSCGLRRRSCSAASVHALVFVTSATAPCPLPSGPHTAALGPDNWVCGPEVRKRPWEHGAGSPQAGLLRKHFLNRGPPHTHSLSPA